MLAARQLGVSVADQLARILPAEVASGPRAAFVQEALRSFAVTQQDEAEFYASLGLNDAFAVCAVGDVLERRPGHAGQIGWGFSLADMARTGPGQHRVPGRRPLRAGRCALSANTSCPSAPTICLALLK